jgi:hypothetical protein
MTQIKPIAMKCSEEQFNAIKHKLSNFDTRGCSNWELGDYLVTNLNDALGKIGNARAHRKDKYNRTVFEEWNEQTFLECCGIDCFVLPEKWAVKITKGNRQVLLEWARKQFKYNGEYENLFVPDAYTLSKHPHDDSYLWSGDITGILCFNPDYRLITFKEFQKYVLKQEAMKKYRNYTVPAADVLAIRAIACETWKKKFSDYLQRIDVDNNVSFDEVEIDAMFKAATATQFPVLEEIFGKPAKAIEFDKIKTGSKVMIEYTGQSCGNLFEGIDFSQPVDVVFFKTPHRICPDGRFFSSGVHPSYCTFHQKGKYVLFAAHKNVDYITEVIEY